MTETDDKQTTKQPRLRWGGGLLRTPIIGIAFAILSQAVHWVGAQVMMPLYQDDKYFHLWSRWMMPQTPEGQYMPPGTSFFILSALFAFITGIIFSLVFLFIRDGLPGRGRMIKGLSYGLVLFMLAGLPGSMSMYLILDIPQDFIVTWGLENLVTYLFGGLLISLLTPHKSMLV